MEQYGKTIKKALGIDDFVVDMILGESARLETLSLQARYPFFFLGLLAILSNSLFPLYGMKRKIRDSVEDFIFVSCPDTVFRTKTLDLIARGLSFYIIYLPNYHILTAIKYHKYFKGKRIPAFFPTIHLRHVLSAKRKIKLLIKETEGFGNDFEGQKLTCVLSSFLIYDAVVKEYMDCVKSFKGKWILEHQKFYFLASVANLHLRGIPSTMLQHGIFFQPVYDFVPLLCDKVLCCSEREKKLYVENGIESERVKVFGAPLQTLQQTNATKNKNGHYDLLVLMTVVEDNVDLVRQVLEHIKTHYKNVLVRMRPRSRKNDEKLLAETLDGMTLSNVGSRIDDDILSCDKVVSLSLDANVEVVKCNKPFVYIWDGSPDDNISQLNCATKDNFKEEIRKLMEADFYSSFPRSKYIDILGENDVDILHEQFVSFIKDGTE